MHTFSSTMAYIICYISLFLTNTQNTIEKTFRNKSVCSYCKMKANLTGFNNRVKWSYYVHANTYIKRERRKGYTVRCEKVSRKINLCICSGALWLVANAIRIFVRSVEDGLEPSQTYGEVNKHLSFCIVEISISYFSINCLNYQYMSARFHD